MKLLRVGSTKTAAGGRSDTMLLVHISKDRDKAMIISLPRDSLVTIPAHRSTDGTKDIGVSKSKINAAFVFIYFVFCNKKHREKNEKFINWRKRVERKI
mgnify:CR=1 FL=1